MADITVEILREIRGGMQRLERRVDALASEVKLHGTTLRGLVLEQHDTHGSIVGLADLVRQVAEDHELRISAIEADAD